ncbi:hypothetical protein jhhlp_003383 [Lomentospora prolificans]|uniref:C2H2-type domain-containing protein n=1 Tax=Lomentospora prolificans TaxID=41688 RepID=A0A2N3NC95_9PEZI|nr:hypothetical protein jhhlp_003383 [Lomentospora prolificans]
MKSRRQNSATKQVLPGGSRQAWPDPGRSCGDLFASLQDGKQVWKIAGKAVEVWAQLGPEIGELLSRNQPQERTRHGLNFQMYMVGKTRWTSSPKIIFCSLDEPTRKGARKEVRKSGILDKHPSIGLADASSTQSLFGRPRPVPPAQAPAGAIPVSTIPAEPANGGNQALLQTPAIPLQLQNGAGFPVPSVSRVASLSIRGKGDTGPHYYRGTVSSINSSSLNSMRSDSSVSSLDFSIHSRYTTPRASMDFRGGGNPWNIEDHPVPCRNSQSCASSDDSSTESEPDEPLPVLDPDDPVAKHSELIIKVLLDAFDTHQRQRNEAVNNHTQDSGTALTSAAAFTRGEPTNGKPSSKRPAPSEPSGDSSNDEEGNRNTEAPNKRRNVNPGQKVFACPFWKWNRDMYSRCSKFTLKRVKDVKQHLGRCHLRCSILCWRCQQQFVTEQQLVEHLQAEESCTRQPPTDNPGLSAQQFTELRNRRQRGATLTDQWFAIWDIVFPGVTRPQSPYLPLTLSDQMDEFGQFYRQHGGPILLEYLRNQGIILSTRSHEEVTSAQLAHVLDAAQATIYDRFTQTQYPVQEVAANPPTGEPVSPGLNYYESESQSVGADAVAGEELAADLDTSADQAGGLPEMYFQGASAGDFDGSEYLHPHVFAPVTEGAYAPDYFVSH